MPNTKFDAKSFNPQAFKYAVDRIPRTRLNEMRKSRALAGNPDIREVFSTQGGTGYARIAMRGLLDGDAVNYDGQTDITATSTKTFEQGVVVIGRAKAWTEKDFSFDITGGIDWMDNVAQQVSEYWQDIDQDTILAVLKGVFAMTGGQSAEFVAKHTYEVAGNMEATTMNSATAQACGDRKKKFSLVFMHSVPATNLENLNLLTALKYTDKDGVTRDLTLYTWNGKTVVVDDGMPAEDGYFPASASDEERSRSRPPVLLLARSTRRRSPPTLGRAPLRRTAMWSPAPATPPMCWVRALSALRTSVPRFPMKWPVTPRRTAAWTPSTPASVRCSLPLASPTKRPARPLSPPRMQSWPTVPTGAWSILVRAMMGTAPTSPTRPSPLPASSPEAKDMEGVYEAVVDRLAMLGYTVTDDDETGLKYTIRKCEAELLANINHRKLPPPLFYTLVDMVAGHFLFDKKAAGGLDGLEGFDFNAPAKSITEGDISVTFAGASDGASNAESRFDAMLAQLMHPAESTLAAFRRLRW